MVSNILTVGPKTMTPASKTIAKIKFVLDRILTPFPKPDKAEIRKIIVNPLIKFKENLLGTNSAKEITKRLYEFLIENEIDRKLEEKREELLNLKWNIIKFIYIQ